MKCLVVFLSLIGLFSLLNVTYTKQINGRGVYVIRSGNHLMSFFKGMCYRRIGNHGILSHVIEIQLVCRVQLICLYFYHFISNTTLINFTGLKINGEL